MVMQIEAVYYEDERYIWCISQNDTYLYRLDKSRAVMEEMFPLLDNQYMKCAYSNILSYNDSFIFVPNNADTIVIVNRSDWTKQYIKLPSIKYRIGQGKVNFWTGVVYKDSLFLFGCSYPGILKVNLISKDLEVIDSWLNEQRLFFISEYDGCFNTNYIMLNHKVYFAFINANAVLQFDLQTEEVKIYKIGDKAQGYISIEYDGTCFWLIPRNTKSGCIVKWNPISGISEYFDDYPTEFDYHQYGFFKTEVIDNKLFMFAHMGNCNITIDMNTGQMESFPHLYCVENVRGCKYPLVWKQNDRILIFRNAEWIIWDTSKDVVEYFPYKLEEKIVCRYKDKEIRDYFEKNRIIVENKYYSLHTYLRYMKISFSRNVFE